MKALQKMSAAALLTCVLALPAIAGEMHAGFAPPPPPSPMRTSPVADEETIETGDVIFDTIATLVKDLFLLL